MKLASCFPPCGIAIVVGATGAIGGALAAQLRQDPSFAAVVELTRTSNPPLEMGDEISVKSAAEFVRSLGKDVRLIIDATGILHERDLKPEKSLSQIDADTLQRYFVINAMGPMLLMKHFLPLLPRNGKSVFATLSAKVGSIGDNELGGWYGYRASKAALNQFVKTAAIELSRRRSKAICVALHPGTVQSKLSQPFIKSGLAIRSPEVAAYDLLETIGDLSTDRSGKFISYSGEILVW